MNLEYTFEELEKILDDGYQIYFTYVRNRYLIYKTSENCYTQELLSDNPKKPLARMQIITHKRLFEMVPFMEDFEYKAGV